ncbi:MAG: DNA repair protein RadC [Candidatus Omnitrophica bacterium]|nr:DNA repair protein RadC [Candidatus Omnitrophota bacterium]
MPIHQWPEAEKPRERLRRLGASQLTDAELLAILLRSGTVGKDAVHLAREMLARFGGIRSLLNAGVRDLECFSGLGAAKIATLLAVNELARRGQREGLLKKNALCDPGAVMEYLYTALSERKKEVFKVIYLDKANCILDERDLFHGTVDAAMVHPREVIHSALESHASALILVHNHPSGRTEPSREDRELTVQLKKACEAVGIQVLDHLIIGQHKYYSFREHGLL